MARINSNIWGVALAYVAIATLFAVPLYLHHQDLVHAHADAMEATTRLQNARPNNAPATVAVAKAVITGTPTRMIIDRLGIDLPVVAGAYNATGRYWYVRDAAGNYAVNTFMVNNDHGTTLIYGHNNPYTFGKTRNLQAGDMLIIKTDNGHVFQYSYVGDAIVDPTDTTIFGDLNTPEPTLKLMTCSGSWFQNRRLMTFKLEKAV